MIQTDLDKVLHPADDPINKQCHDLCIELYRRLRIKEINLQEFLQEISYIALRYGFDELKPRQYPQRPQELVEYDEMPLEKKLAVKSEFFRQFHIANYLETYHKVKWWNRYTQDWLEELANYIPKDDEINQHKIKDRLLEFIDNPLGDKLIEEFEGTEI